MVHVVILSALAAATFSAQDRDKKPINFDSALAGYRQGEREELNVWADPADIPRDQAIGNEHGAPCSDGQSIKCRMSQVVMATMATGAEWFAACLRWWVTLDHATLSGNR